MFIALVADANADVRLGANSIWVEAVSYAGLQRSMKLLGEELGVAVAQGGLTPGTPETNLLL
jgi:hypothetical protein